jgi:transposase-like protein
MRLQMAQHFLLSAAARQLSLAEVARMGEDDARAMFRALRWHATGGDPVCPRCGCLAVYEYRAAPVFKCKACLRQFSVTSGTIFHSRKLAFRDHLLAIAIFVNGAKGVSALQLGRDLDVSYKTAFVLAHKLREAMSAENAQATAAGHVEVDGAYFGGQAPPREPQGRPQGPRLLRNQTGKRKVVVVMRERGGRTLPFVVRAEDEGVATVARRVAKGSTVYADEASHWDALHARFDAKRINHGFAFSDDGACTNQAESFFAGSGGPSWASTTTSPAPTSSSTRARWRGARTPGATTTAPMASWPAWRRWATREPQLVRVLAAAFGLKRLVAR